MSGRPARPARLRTLIATTVAGLVLASGLAACSENGATEATTTTTDVVQESTTTTQVPLSAGKQVSFYVPVVGDCYDVRPVDKAPPIYLKLDCALPHQNEVFAAFDYTLTKEYPGPDGLETEAKKQCPKSWTDYVGAPYETSRFEIAYNLPDVATWGNGIRHVIGCLVVDPKGDLVTGSVRGSGQ